MSHTAYHDITLGMMQTRSPDYSNFFPHYIHSTFSKMLPAPLYIDYEDYSATEDARALGGGSCWKKVFTEPTPEDWRGWIGLNEMGELSKAYKVSEGYFTVEMVGPGIIHIEETEDETEWCVGDIFQLPRGWYKVG